jgi:hypothetical protein
VPVESGDGKGGTGTGGNAGGVSAEGTLKGVLNTLIGDLGALPAGSYTADTYAALLAAVNAAKALVSDPAATSTQLATALANLAKAATALTPTGTGPGVPALADTVKGSQSRVTLLKGRSLTVAAKGYTVAGEARSVTWKSANSKVAAVSKAGKITAKRTGKTTVTASADGKSWKVAVTVVAKRPASYKSTSIQASVPKTLKTGQVAYVTGKYSPARAVGSRVRYSSSNSGVLAVDSTGRVLAKAAGTATLTVRTQFASKKYKVTVS